MIRETTTAPRTSWREDAGKTVLVLSGDWLRGGPRVTNDGGDGKDWPDQFDASGLGEFDSTLPAFLLALRRRADAADAKPPPQGLPADLQKLMELALGVPESSDAKIREEDSSMLARLGMASSRAWTSTLLVSSFIGETVLSLARLFTGAARFRRQDFIATLQECGVGALPIVSLISFLIGLILAFVGNVQLANFGASLYVADLVGLAMVREMGVVMTAIIMSGRTGAAFAAHIGSMNANQEIDALKTFGFNPFDFLVLPRVLAMVLMMPLLTIYSNVIGILGGMLVAAFVGIPPALFWTELVTVLTPLNSSLGVIKSVFFGVAIAICGCLQGMHSGNSSAAVGQATTRAVVASITTIIVLDSAFAVAFTLLDI
jgi:phospholipid/cholesterol/gamma-HCH transport system permease protein